VISKIRATTFKDSQKSFLEMLEAHSIQYSRIMQLSEAPMAAGITIEIIITGGWGALAVACLAWAHVRKSRKISVVTKDNQSIWLEGYSTKEATKILEAAERIAVIDTKSQQNEERGGG